MEQTYESLNQLTKYDLIKMILANQKGFKTTTNKPKTTSNFVPFAQRSEAEKKAYFESIGKVYVSRDEWLKQRNTQQQTKNVISNRAEMNLDDTRAHSDDDE